MFDLEQAIVEWRQRMLAAGLKTPAVLDELESHLRDETAQQVHSGSSVQEAFEAAVQELGTASALRAEFHRARLPDEAQLRKWAGFLYAALLVFYACAQTRQLLRWSPTHHEFLLGIASVAATLITAFAAWRLVPGWMNHISDKATRSVVTIAGSVSGLAWLVVFAWFVLPYFDFTPGQFFAAWVWAMLPMLICPTVLLGADWSGDGTGKGSSPASPS